jgi:hypothetical protein
MSAHSPARSWPPNGPGFAPAPYGQDVAAVIAGRRPARTHVGAPHYPVGGQPNPWAQNGIRLGNAVGINDQATVVRSRAHRVVAYPSPPSGPPFPPPGWHPGPALAPLPTPRGNRRLRWAVIGGVAAAALAITLGTGLVVTAADDSEVAAVDTAAIPPPSPPSSSTPAPAPVVALSALPGLLLNTATINSIEGSHSIAVLAGGETALAYSGLDNDRPDCGEIQGPALQSALDNSGWVGVRTQSLADPNGTEHLINNAVIYYPSAQAANDFAAKQAEAWARCNGATLHTTSSSDAPSIWLVATTTDEGGVLSVTTTQEGGGGWGCQHALVVRNNIVTDSRSCGESRTDQARSMASRMADRIAAQ